MIGLTARVNGAEELKSWARAMPGEFQERTRGLVISYAGLIEGEARQRVSVKTGHGKAAIHTVYDFSGHRSRAIIGVGPEAFYLLFVEEGTGLWGPKHEKYEIRPKNKKALAFFSRAGTSLATGKALYRSARRPGKLVSTKSAAARTVVRKVIHPGISPRPFLIPAFERYLPAFQRDLAAVIEHLAGRG